jgi:hypothetical protein
MKKLTFYEQVGIVIPDVVLLFGLLFFVPSLKDVLAKDGVSIGQLGIFLLLSYAAGHLIAAIGNFGESLLWRLAGGMPSNWVLKERTSLLSDKQRARLPEKIKARLGLCPALDVSYADRPKHLLPNAARGVAADRLRKRDARRDLLRTQSPESICLVAISANA